MTKDELIEYALLQANGSPVTISALMKATQRDHIGVSNAISRLRRIYGSRLVGKRGGDGYYIDTKSVVDKPKPPHISIVPNDLWRGWYNPSTGVRGACLGLDNDNV